MKKIYLFTSNKYKSSYPVMARDYDAAIEVLIDKLHLKRCDMVTCDIFLDKDGYSIFPECDLFFIRNNHYDEMKSLIKDFFVLVPLGSFVDPDCIEYCERN